MLKILEYDFMVKAFVVGGLIAIIISCVGVIVVMKRMSMIGDALSHASLAGVAAGLIMGYNPIVGAVVTCILAAFGIEAIRKKIPQYSEMSIAIVMSAGIGLAGVLSGFVNNAANFNSFLFGSIVAISYFELWLMVGVSVLVGACFLLFYKELFYIAFDERAAQLSGVPVKSINFLFTLLTAATISVASRTIGALIVSSLMVVPVACAMQVGRSFKQTILFSILFALTFTFAGLFLSFYGGLKPGGTIVLIGIVVLVILMIVKAVKRR